MTPGLGGEYLNQDVTWEEAGQGRAVPVHVTAATAERLLAALPLGFTLALPLCLQLRLRSLRRDRVPDAAWNGQPP